ncbi:MAG: GDSL-type esterase/lipase family protein [Candidatus Paceibacterota bacterium]
MIIIFGDSIVQGAFDSECGGWVSRLAAHHNKLSLNGGAKTQVANLGISGDDICGIIKRFANELEVRLHDDRESLVVIAVGINDSKVHIETGKSQTPIVDFKETLKEIIKKAKQYPNLQIVCMGLLSINQSQLDPLPWGPEVAYRESEVKRFNSAIEETAKEEEIPFIPLHDVFGERYKDLLPDGLHPNAEGHKLIFERVKEYLEKLNLIPKPYPLPPIP